MWQKPVSSRCLCFSLLSIIRGFMEWGGRQEGAWKLLDTSSAWELNLKISGLWKWRERTRICQNGSDFLFSFSLAWTERQWRLLGGVRFKEVDAVQGDSLLWKTFPNTHTHTHTHTYTHTHTHTHTHSYTLTLLTSDANAFTFSHLTKKQNLKCTLGM